MSLATLVFVYSFLMCTLVGVTEKSMSFRRMASASLALSPPLAKINRYTLSRKLLHASRIFLMSVSSIAASSSLWFFGIVTLFLNLFGLISTSQCSRYPLTAATYKLTVLGDNLQSV